jgi:putative heme-binding domain-containing protein
VRKWRVIGPFPAGERPPVRVGKPIDPKGVVDDPKLGKLAWVEVAARDPNGMVDLSALYSGKDTGRKSAFAYAEIESNVARPARLTLGSDDSIRVWVNGKSVFEHRDDRGFTPDENSVDIALKKGVNLIFLKVGNNSGGWQFAVGVSGEGDYAFLQGPAPGAFDAEAFREFAVGRKGDPARGKALFVDAKGIGCIKCHAVAGQGGAVGPDLTGIATRYSKDELIHSVLYPSAKIFSGYEPTIVATADGKVVTGIVKSEDTETIVLEDAEAVKHTIAKKEIEERKTSDVSLMPNGLAEGLTREDFADLVGYLETLRDPAPAKPAQGR